MFKPPHLRMAAVGEFQTAAGLGGRLTPADGPIPSQKASLMQHMMLKGCRTFWTKLLLVSGLFEPSWQSSHRRSYYLII